jgi:hypothetical protein
VDLYIHSPIRLHGVVLNYLSTGTTLPLPYSDIGNRDSAVGIATDYRLDDRGADFESLLGQEFSLLHVVQTGSGVHPTSYSIGTGGSFPEGKAAGA